MAIISTFSQDSLASPTSSQTEFSFGASSSGSASLSGVPFAGRKRILPPLPFSPRSLASSSTAPQTEFPCGASSPESTSLPALPLAPKPPAKKATSLPALPLAPKPPAKKATSSVQRPTPLLREALSRESEEIQEMVRSNGGLSEFVASPLSPRRIPTDLYFS